MLNDSREIAVGESDWNYIPEFWHIRRFYFRHKLHCMSTYDSMHSTPDSKPFVRWREKRICSIWSIDYKNPVLSTLNKRLLKTLCEKKKKMLVTMIFSFSHNASLPVMKIIDVHEPLLNSHFPMLFIWMILECCPFVKS